ncbi:MAG: 1-acyl-sn-glycerol-3-phosphate acyltransferase, partial [Bacteroidota bacterium]
MNWFNRQLYRLLKIITKTVLWIYYPKTSVLNRKRLKFDQPTIIACSHPNTMMDPLHVASRTKNPVFFLANADLFATKFGNWFYSNFFCIPIRRQMDNKGTHVKNEDSFSRVIEFLKSGGCLWVAPEGGSYWGRHWMKLKTGTARMGLMTETAHDFQANVQILPVGLNYEAPNLFRTSLVINVGEGIQVKDYRTDHEESPRKAIYQLTKDIEERLQALEISPIDEEEDYLLSQL